MRGLSASIEVLTQEGVRVTIRLAVVGSGHWRRLKLILI
jgi:hypothetical protein